MATILSLDQKHSAAALVIQRAFRKYRFSVIYGLDKHLVEQAYQRFISQKGEMENLPRAAVGKTPVYFPTGMPIVLKRSGKTPARKRLKEMEAARGTLLKLGKDAIAVLVIPKARVFGPFIVEQRLPIPGTDVKISIGLYLDHMQEFDPVVRQFVMFLCESKVIDITGKTTSPYSALSKTLIPKYDNVVPYRDKDQVKLALVDLEGYEPNHPIGPLRPYNAVVMEAIRLFPHHLETIINAVKTFDPEIEKHIDDFKREQIEALAFFDCAYVNHLRFIQLQGITSKNPGFLFTISPEIETELTKVAINVLKKENQEWYFKDCLGEEPDKMLAEIQAGFPLVLKELRALIEGLLQHNITKQEISESSSIPQLLACRTLTLSNRLIGKNPYAFFIETAKNTLPPFSAETENPENLTSMMMKEVLSEMAKRGLLSYYNPSWGRGASAVQCIFL